MPAPPHGTASQEDHEGAARLTPGLETILRVRRAVVAGVAPDLDDLRMMVAAIDEAAVIGGPDLEDALGLAPGWGLAYRRKVFGQGIAGRRPRIGSKSAEARDWHDRLARYHASRYGRDLLSGDPGADRPLFDVLQMFGGDVPSVDRLRKLLST